MKIKLAVATTKGKHPNIEFNYKLVDTLKDANKIKGNSIDKKTIHFLGVLEQNADFIKEVVSIRKEFEIKESGLQFEDWLVLKSSKRKDDSYNKWKFSIDKASRKQLVEKFRIPYLLQSNLVYIVIANFIYVPLPKILLEVPNTLMPVYDGPEIILKIQSPVSKRQLIEFVESNWSDIEENMHMFGNELDVFVSDRDKEIIFMRDVKKMKYSEIADVIAQKTDNYEINEDMIKRAYHRAKYNIKKISG